MKKRKKSEGKRRRTNPVAGMKEWVGGSFEAPFVITDREEPYHPYLFVWMELPERVILAYDVAAPEDVEGALGRSFLEAVEKPMMGPPRRPRRIRVAEDSLVEEVRAAVAGKIPVQVGPTPELDDLIEHMFEHGPAARARKSYLEGDGIRPEDMEALFAASRVLFLATPWKVAGDSQLLRVDIPALGVEGACASIVGALDQELGFLLFPSLAGFEAFAEAAERGPSEEGPLDLGTEWTALTFEKGADLPEGIKREVADYGWEIAGENAYPSLECRERDGMPRRLTVRDVKIATACARALASFVLRHREIFESDGFEPVCESQFDEEDLEVRLTAPYEALPLFFEGEQSGFVRGRASGSKISRNDPCPCGSGRKYKKCHLPIEEGRPATRGAERRGRESPLHDLDGGVVGKLFDFAVARFGNRWKEFHADFADVEEAMELAGPWSVYHFRIGNSTVAEAYLESEGRRCSEEERAWLKAQLAAWLSVWEVLEVEPGESLTLRDLLSGEVRRVREVSASEALVVRDAILARVVDFQGESVLSGVHPKRLPPFQAAAVVEAARRKLRRKRAVAPERLRNEALGRRLIRGWEEALASLLETASRPKVLCNTDGDKLLLTVDHFDLRTGKREVVASRLASLEDVDRESSEDGSDSFGFLRRAASEAGAEGDILVGNAVLSENRLRLETNSVERADALRRRVETACGSLISHRIREHVDPLSDARDSGRKREFVEPTPEIQELIRAEKARHYRDWLDRGIPALGDRTPREASRSAEGRAALDVLLKDMENREQHFDKATAFDFSGLRRELGLK